MKTKNPAATAEAVAAMQERLDALTACTTDDYILAYDNGLGIAFTAGPDFKPYVCGLERADTVGHDGMPEEAWAYTPIVKNGHGEQAKVVRRQAAIKAELPKIADLIEMLKAA